MFLNYLTAFEHDGVEYTNTEKTKARKLATIKSFFKYNYNKDRIPADPASKVLSLKLHDKAIIRLEVDEKGERIAINEMRKHLAYYVRNRKDASKLREKINKIEERIELENCLRQYFN